MEKGNPVDLQMEKMVLEKGKLDRTMHKCKVLKYMEERERIYLFLEDEPLTNISLDGIYQCDISTREGLLRCDGMIDERYQNKAGNVLVFRIENGFYNINVK